LGTIGSFITHPGLEPAMSRRFLSFLLLGALLTACQDDPDEDYLGPTEPQLAAFAAEAGGGGAEPFDVYTQNVYLGGDTGPLFTLDLTNVPAVVAATNTFWSAVQQSEAADRMAAIVDEIDRRRPHVVGLQEVLRFVVLNDTMTPIDGLDLLALIEAEIAARGLPYTTEVVQSTTSAGLPLAVGASGITRLLSFTDRLVVLRRNDVTIQNELSGVYAAAVPLGPVTLRRGWAGVSVEHDGTIHHFVTTHLEVQALAPVQAAQRQQLLDQVLSGLDGVTILAGDLNSDASAEPGDVSWTDTYDVVVAAGFGDLWEMAPRGGRHRGFTCCQDPSLVNPSELDQRIDFVMVRMDESLRPNGKARGHYRVDVVGEAEADRTSGGLWPADHAGVVGSLRAVRRGPER
jgi:endonuclease/exonuclease/phosphatase family metal-dependent hydrolase